MYSVFDWFISVAVSDLKMLSVFEMMVIIIIRFKAQHQVSAR